MKAIVTGGAGFIGSHLAMRLLSEGWEVVILDNLSSGHERNLPAGAEFRWFDLASAHAYPSLNIDGVDAIFHLASHVGQELSFLNPVYDLQANALSTLCLIQWAQARKVPKLVFASTMNLYGDPEALPVTEDSPVRPPSPYAVGKLASEHLCDIYRNAGLHTACLRLFNVYGPGQDMRNMKQGMVSIFMSYVAKGVPIHVRGAPDRFRDFVYVDDVVDAFLRALAPAASGRIYNVCTGVKTRVDELLQRMIRAYGREPGYPVTFGEPTPKDQFGVYGDRGRISRELGWEPRTGLDEGLAAMAEWARRLDPALLPDLK